MGFADSKLRLANRSAIEKADIESVYGELVRAIGGTYYSSGVAQGPANGSLDWRNFHPSAGIPNTNRSNRYSIETIQITSWPHTYSATAAVNFYTPVSWEQVLYDTMNATVVGWTLTSRSSSNPTNSGTAKLFYVKEGTATQIGATQTLTNVGNFTVDVNVTGLSQPIEPRGILRLEYAISTAGVSVQVISATVLISVEHTR